MPQCAWKPATLAKQAMARKLKNIWVEWQMMVFLDTIICMEGVVSRGCRKTLTPSAARPRRIRDRRTLATDVTDADETRPMSPRMPATGNEADQARARGRATHVVVLEHGMAAAADARTWHGRNPALSRREHAPKQVLHAVEQGHGARGWLRAGGKEMGEGDEREERSEGAVCAEFVKSAGRASRARS
jgi:hypothetical protein